MNLTKLAIERAEYQGKAYGTAAWTRDVRWDKKLIGFGVRIYPSQKKTFIVSYRVNGRKKLKTLGKVGVMPLDEARRLCADALKKIQAKRYLHFQETKSCGTRFVRQKV
jgi:nucleoside-triphosphatase THEP1